MPDQNLKAKSKAWEVCVRDYKRVRIRALAGLRLPFAGDNLAITRNPNPLDRDATIKLGKHILLHGVFSGVFVDRYGPFSSFSGRAAPAPRPRAFT